jgi:hypothetical protein
VFSGKTGIKIFPKSNQICLIITVFETFLGCNTKQKDVT